MANNVKISVVGMQHFSLDTNIPKEKAVDEMMKNLKSELEQVLPDKPDLIVLPEACDMPANYNFEQRIAFYKARGDSILELFSNIARDNHCYITYAGIREMQDSTWRNSIQLIDRNGTVAGVYNKNHPTEQEIEEGIKCGRDAQLIECDFGKVACAICFDLNFNELRMKYVNAKPNLIIFSSMFHGGLLQNYWAYSCRSHFAGSIANARPSSIISPVGEIIDSNTNYFDFVTATVNLDCAVVHLDNNWGKLSSMKSKYGCKVKITDPGYLGSVLISCETDECTVEDMVNEFEIELLDEYFSRMLNMHHQHENKER